MIRIVNLFILLFFHPTVSKQPVDLLVYNGVVYTVDSSFTVAQAFAVSKGKIIEVGKTNELLAKYESTTKIDAQGKAIFPGFIDAHCHFLSYGRNLQRIDLKETHSFKEVIQRAKSFYEIKKPEWLLGRGWDQNDWEVKEFPDRAELDSLFPNVPVVLTRVDGHAALVNGEALKRAGLNEHSVVDGGVVEVKKGRLTGVLIDNAIELVTKIIPELNTRQLIQALGDAEKKCFAVGITTVDDAGLPKRSVNCIDSLHSAGKLKMKVYAMLSSIDENFDHYLSRGVYKTARLNVSSFKFYADGALGSRGACLLEPYHDKPGQQGFLLSKPAYFKQYAEKIYAAGFQMNTHCIGDSATRYLLDVYAQVLKGKNNKRWRIEHAQVISPSDFDKFSAFSIIPSVQPTHATSDMYWAKDRLGEERVKGAYAYKMLLNKAGLVSLGTDFPVEDINPMYTFFASVARKDLKGFPDGGFQMNDALTRQETLMGMTIWAAYSNFEELEKGSIEKNKWADFVILENDIMKVDLDKIPSTKVISTFVNGEKVYDKR